MKEKVESVSENIFIPQPKKLEKLKKIFIEQGKDKIHVLVDFDRTLTQAYVNGEKVPSIISILRDGRFLTSDYSQKAQELFNQYHPIEIDTQLPLPVKKKKMEEWWRRHFDLLIKSGLSQKEIVEVAKDPRLQFRSGALQLLEILHKHQIPLVIMSSAGLGRESISFLLQREKHLFDNIRIISNEFEYDQNGKVKGIKEPIIHTLNKDETIVKDFPEVFAKIKDKKNVVLLGDNIEDIGMIEGFDYDNLIKVGFLNESVEENLEAYKKNFDVVILNDGEMDLVNKILKEVL